MGFDGPAFEVRPSEVLPLKEIGAIPVFKRPECMPGLLIAAYFSLKLLAYVHLGLIGVTVPAMTGRLEDGSSPEPGGEVIYFYRVNGVTYHGWRRGVEYGGQALSVVHSPIANSFHVSSLKAGLPSRFGLWLEVDFWLRLALAGGGLALGLLVIGFPAMWRKRNWRFLHGLDRDGPPA